ncbi:PAAR-like domain-containing protein [Oceanospirillum maris]|uniref:PAAR-like domain-containing protein n=1 Tax=Oceanospirillum maris TaxID=64977 RepID=UPI0003F67151|nr:PAAR-like domain-containing protein [Oceanospirillum maris]
MFANSQQGAMSMMMPDVCKVPAPPAPPIPMPFPNMANSMLANPSTASTKVMMMNMPAHSLKTLVPLSMGDTPGVAGGLISSKIMSECRHMMGSMKVMVQGQPATKMSAITGQNGAPQNGPPGITMKPAQAKVMLMG